MMELVGAITKIADRRIWLQRYPARLTGRRISRRRDGEDPRRADWRLQPRDGPASNGDPAKNDKLCRQDLLPPRPSQGPRITAWQPACGRTPSTDPRGRPGWPRTSTQR